MTLLFLKFGGRPTGPPLNIGPHGITAPFFEPASCEPVRRDNKLFGARIIAILAGCAVSDPSDAKCAFRYTSMGIFVTANMTPLAEILLTVDDGFRHTPGLQT